MCLPECMGMQCLCRPEEDVMSPGTEVTDGYELGGY